MDYKLSQNVRKSIYVLKLRGGIIITANATI
jgi:hypothetical protein